MKLEQQLKLQSYLDGELPFWERPFVSAWIARDAEARACLAELQATRTALIGNEPEATVPESREFYWSKIERAIQSAEQEPARLVHGHVFAWLRRLAVPAASVATLVLAATLMVNRQGAMLGDGDFETALADTAATTYRDHANGVTFVWLSYPASDDEVDYEALPRTGGE